MQPGECLQALRYEVRILSHALRKGSLLYTVEYDTPAPADLEHAPDRRNRKRHRLYCRMDRRLAECRGFSRRGAIELHDAGAPLEYLGQISRREQSADGLTHRIQLLRLILGENIPFARHVLVRGATTKSSFLR